MSSLMPTALRPVLPLRQCGNGGQSPGRTKMRSDLIRRFWTCKPQIHRDSAAACACCIETAAGAAQNSPFRIGIFTMPPLRKRLCWVRFIRADVSRLYVSCLNTEKNALSCQSGRHVSTLSFSAMSRTLLSTASSHRS